MVRIVADSAADIAPVEAEAMGVELVSLAISFPRANYDQQRDADTSEFYRLLQADVGFPKTSQPPPEAFAAIFADAREKGDSVVAVLISSGLSGTFQSAQIAKDMVGYQDVYLIDSRCAIMPQRILVERAAEMRDAGSCAAEIAGAMESLRERVRVFGILDTLHYLYKGGRLPRTVALAGDLLHIKPVITARDGVIKLVGRGRNAMSLLNWFTEKVGFDPTYPVYFGFTASDAPCKKLMTHVCEQFRNIRTGIFPIGGTVGAHVGPNGSAISFVLPK